MAIFLSHFLHILAPTHGVASFFPDCFELYDGSQSFQCGVTRSARVDEDIEVEDPKRHGVLVDLLLGWSSLRRGVFGCI